MLLNLFSAKTRWEDRKANCLFQWRDFKSPQQERFLDWELELKLMIFKTGKRERRRGAAATVTLR